MLSMSVRVRMIDAEVIGHQQLKSANGLAGSMWKGYVLTVVSSEQDHMWFVALASVALQSEHALSNRSRAVARVST